MKTFFTFLLLIPSLVFSQVVLEDFENNRNIYYGFISGNFDPAGFASIVGATTNPDQTGDNTSSFCGKYTRNATEQYDVILFSPYSNFTDLGDYTSGVKTMSIDVWSPSPNTVVQITFENSTIAQPDNYPTGRHSRFEATTSVTNGWETITFSFLESPDANIMDQDVDQGVILINPETSDNITVYLDNLTGPNNDCIDATVDFQVFDDFECQRNGEYSFSHGVLQILNNPDATGLNTSSKVGKYTRSDFKNNDVLIFEFSQNLELASNEVLSLKLWSTNSKDVIISLQDDSGTNSFDQNITLPGSSSWQQFTFDYDDQIPSSVDITKAVFLFAPDEAGFPYEFYMDDFSVVETSNISDISTNNSIKIENNKLVFNESNSIKQISIFDSLGRLLQKSETTNNFYEVEHKGLLLINVQEKNNSSTIKLLNN